MGDLPRRPWYRMDGERVLATDAHPLEPPETDYYRLCGDLVYPIDGSEPWFEQRGSFVYPLESHPLGESPRPWYQLR